MSHVDEGTLHAWLDGALDALPAVEAERVREHLASCELCRARLEEERAIRQEAADILGGAAPGLLEAPAFEELRARAETRGRPRRASLRLYRWGWAASVVLALGVGWMLRDAAVPDFGRERPGAPEARSTDEAAGAPTAPADADAVREGTAPAAGARQGLAPTASTEEREAETPPVRAPAGAPGAKAARTDAADAPRRAKTGSVVVDPSAQGAPVAAAASTPIPSPTERLFPERSWLPVSIRATVPEPRFDTLAFPRTAAEANEVVAAASKREADPSVAGDDTLRRVWGRRADFLVPGSPTNVSAAPSPAGGRQAAPVAGEFVRLGAAELGPVSPESLQVPGLEVLSTTRLDAEGLPGGIRVRQRMADGDTLEVVYLPAGISTAGLHPVEDGRTELVLPRGGGWLVVRAHADQGTLRDLVRSIPGGG